MSTTEDVVVHLGPWHYSVLLFVFYRGFPYAYHAMAPSFTAPDLEHWCARPTEFSNLTKDEWLAKGIPRTIEGDEQSLPSRCEMFAITRNPDGTISIQNDTRVPCSRWEYQMDSYTNTLTNQFNLVCDRVWLRAASQSIYMLGIMFGNVIYSHLSDWYGRKTASAFAIPVSIVGGLVASFSTNFVMFNIFRFVTSLGIGGLQNISYTFVSEVLSARHRPLCSIFTTGGWTTGMLTLVGIAWLIRDWMYLQLTITATLIGFCINWPFLPESPRWLLATAKYEEAKKTLDDAVKRNKVKNVDVDMIVKNFQEKMTETNIGDKPTFVQLFRLPSLRWRTFKIATFAMMNMLMYYNLTYASTLRGNNPYLSFAVVTVMEYPILILSVLVVRYIKRRSSQVIVLCISAICSAIPMFLPTHMSWLQLCCAVLAKCGNMCSYAIYFVQLSELYPTKIRNVAIGFCMTMSRVGASLAPFTKELGVIIAPWVPSAVDTILCICMAVLGFTLPETYQVVLPDTIQDIEQRRRKEAVTKLKVFMENVENDPLQADSRDG